jgi:hypothetical protein
MSKRTTNLNAVAFGILFIIKVFNYNVHSIEKLMELPPYNNTCPLYNNTCDHINSPIEFNSKFDFQQTRNIIESYSCNLNGR